MMAASFVENAAVSFVRKDGEVLHYTGGFSANLAVGTVPYGGSINATIVNACLHAVQDSPLNEIIHMTINYYKACSPGSCDIQVRILRQSRTFQNVQVDIIQAGIQRTTAHLLVGQLPEAPLDPRLQPRALTLVPSSSLYRRSPVFIHPSTAPVFEYPAAWSMSRSFRISHDPVYEHRNHAKTGTTKLDGSDADMNGVIEDGRLLQLVHPKDKLNQVTIAAIADNLRPLNMLVPKSELPKIGARELQQWATIVATIEFKHRPPRSLSYSDNTVAMYTHTRFATAGRGDMTAELWSAPPGVVGDSSGVVEDGWREKMVCLAVMTQMAVVMTKQGPTTPAGEQRDRSRL